jgi:hypothetical protein
MHSGSLLPAAARYHIPGKNTPVMVRMSAGQLKALDGWRRDQEDLPGRPEAIRRLVENALDAHDAANRRKPEMMDDMVRTKEQVARRAREAFKPAARHDAASKEITDAALRLAKEVAGAADKLSEGRWLAAHCFRTHSRCSRNLPHIGLRSSGTRQSQQISWPQGCDVAIHSLGRYGCSDAAYEGINPMRRIFTVRRRLSKIAIDVMS